jgi:hypothetical protein
MFTNEIEFDESIITVLDDCGLYEDIKVFLDDQEVYIQQYNNKKDKMEFVVMSAKMFYELMEAMKKPAGAYISNRKINNVK